MPNLKQLDQHSVGPNPIVVPYSVYDLVKEEMLAALRRSKPRSAYDGLYYAMRCFRRRYGSEAEAQVHALLDADTPGVNAVRRQTEILLADEWRECHGRLQTSQPSQP